MTIDELRAAEAERIELVKKTVWPDRDTNEPLVLWEPGSVEALTAAAAAEAKGRRGKLWEDQRLVWDGEKGEYRTPTEAERESLRTEAEAARANFPQLDELKPFEEWTDEERKAEAGDIRQTCEYFLKQPPDQAAPPEEGPSFEEMMAKYDAENS